MSFEQLMEHATNIQSTAIRLAVQRKQAEPEYAAPGVEGYYADIPGLFKPFSLMPNPAAYDPMINELRDILSKLSAGDHGDPINTRENYYANVTLAKMTTAGTYLGDWVGGGAQAFKKNFVDTFPPVARNQFILTAVLKAALEGHRAMWESARKDIDEIAHKILAALEVNNCCDSPATWTVSFTVLASIAAVAAVPLAEVGLAAAVTVTAIGAASQVVAAVPPQPTKVDYAGSSVLQVINNMKTAIKKVADDIHETESKIKSALDATHDQVFGHQQLFVANRPLLADAPAGRISSLEYLGYAG